MKKNSVVVLFVNLLFLVYTPHFSFSKEMPSLSGKYEGYNVILIILDALRPDRLSCYGYAKQTSPNIDALAKDGIRFTNAFSQASYTLPSVTSIFTSVYPYSHRVMHIFKDKVPDKIYTLAQILSTCGYSTVWFGFMDDPHSGSAKGLLEGFKQKFDITHIERVTNNYDIVTGWIKEHREGPFFLTIHSYSVHEQTFPFRRFDNRISQRMPKDFSDFSNELELKAWNKLQEIYKDNPEEINGILGKEWVENNKEYFIIPFSQKRIKDFNALFQTSEERAKRVKLDLLTQHEFWRLILLLNKQQFLYFLALLDSAIYEVDKDMIGELVKELKALNLYDKTIIIITADHGNEYKEHSNLFHGPWLYDKVMRVPLILHLPNFKKPAVVKEFAQSIDILPTTLDLLGIGIPHQAQGISLVGLMEGRKNALRNEYIFCQGAPEGTAAIRSKEWKLIQKPIEGKSGEESLDYKLYNLKRDPHEMGDLLKDKPRIADALRKRLNAWMGSLVVYQEGKSEFMPGLQEETKEKIKKTGYW